LKELNDQRNASKQVIYEITGISDIMRSASDPNETFGAQKIKTQWGTQRLQRMQKEIQRYIRDLIRMKAEIIAEKFQIETLEKMTLLPYPKKSDVDKQFAQQMQQYHAQVAQMHQQYAMQVAQAHEQAKQAHFQALDAHAQGAQQAVAQGQPVQPQPQPQAPQIPPQPQTPPPPQYPDNIITWEKVVEAMRDDATRTYRVDIESDSTLSATQDSDLTGIKDVLTSVSQIMQGFGPAVQQGDISIDVLKELIMSVVRRAKMGTAVEDALNKMQQPKPPVDPEAGKAQAAQAQQQAQIQHEQALEQFKAQNAAQTAQIQAQANQQIEQMKAQVNQASEQARAQADAQVEQARAQASVEVERAKLQAQFQVDEANRNHNAQLQAMQHNHDAGLSSQQVEFEKWKIEQDMATKIVVAEINAKTTLGTSLMAAQNAANATVTDAMPDKGNEALQEIHAQTLGAIQQLTDTINKPKKIVRDASGKVTGVAPDTPPLTNAQGHKLHRDKHGNHAYVGPNGEVTNA
jgi:F0F1-type ATP synthase membrane subunit b/b'